MRGITDFRKIQTFYTKYRPNKDPICSKCLYYRPRSLNKDPTGCTGEDDEFYKMCYEDNQIILELIESENIIIPKMRLNQLKDILFKKLKLNKACDIFKLTVEHLRNCGDRTLNLILQLLNLIIEHLNYLSSPQLNTAVATVIHKGKGKSVYNYKSYRQVRVTPLIGRLLDGQLRLA